MMFREENVTPNQWTHRKAILDKYHEYHKLRGTAPFVRETLIGRVTVAEFEIIIQTLEEALNITIN
jgi:hypothetical protein